MPTPRRTTHTSGAVQSAVELQSWKLPKPDGQLVSQLVVIIMFWNVPQHTSPLGQLELPEHVSVTPMQEPEFAQV